MSDVVLRVSNLHVWRGRRHILKGIDFSVRSGEIFGILGGNGSGKSTTIKAILDLIPYTGSVQWNVPLDRVAYVPQRPALYFDFTLRENIEIFSRISPRVVSNVAELLDYFEISRFLDRRIRDLSGGYQKLANLVISLLTNPRVLVLDEPTAEIDYDARYKIMRFLRAFAAVGNTVIVVTHVPGEANELCDRIMVVGEGRNVVVGTPSEVLEVAGIPYVVKIYGVDPALVASEQLTYCRIRRADANVVEIEVSPSLATKGLREAMDFAERVGAERVFVEEPDVIRAVEMGVGRRA